MRNLKLKTLLPVVFFGVVSAPNSISFDDLDSLNPLDNADEMFVDTKSTPSPFDIVDSNEAVQLGQILATSPVKEEEKYVPFEGGYESFLVHMISLSERRSKYANDTLQLVNYLIDSGYLSDDITIAEHGSAYGISADMPADDQSRHNMLKDFMTVVPASSFADSEQKFIEADLTEAGSNIIDCFSDIFVNAGAERYERSKYNVRMYFNNGSVIVVSFDHRMIFDAQKGNKTNIRFNGHFDFTEHVENLPDFKNGNSMVITGELSTNDDGISFTTSTHEQYYFGKQIGRSIAEKYIDAYIPVKEKVSGMFNNARMCFLNERLQQVDDPCLSDELIFEWHSNYHNDQLLVDLNPP